MSRENVVISMDGHTECFLNLKPWLANHLHGAFDADGVSAEILIDGFGPTTYDPQLQHEIALAFIRWFKDYTSAAPYRYTAALVASLAAGPELVVQEICLAHENGIRCIHMPPTPQIASPSLPHYNHACYEPIWRALNERSMAAIWHASVGREKPQWRWNGTERGWESLLMLDVETLHHSVLKYLLLAGIPERHPHMKFGYIESGSEWIGPILKQLDRYFAAPTQNPQHKLTMKPSEQWARQGFAAGPLDAREVSLRHEVGVGNLLFGSDYIHTEGTYPNTRKHLAKILADVPEDERWAIVAGNAARMFGFDVDKLAHTKAASQNWLHYAPLAA